MYRGNYGFNNIKYNENNWFSQLSEIIEKDDLKDYIKGQNSIKYNPTSLEEITGIAPERKSLTLQEARFLKSDIYQDFNPQIMDDVYTGGTLDGNNVELEKEMMDMSKTGMQYILLSNLQKQSFSGLSSIIKGE